MVNSRQVKKWLKDNGIEVKYIRSISGVRRGKKVTHYIEGRSGSLTEIFPMEMREKMLKIVYGEKFDNANGRWSAGNVAPHMVSMRPMEWKKLMEDY